MQIERLCTQDFVPQPTFAPDFQPMYSLTEPTYNSVINNLASLVYETVQQLHEANQSVLAQQIADSASRILQNYDEDMAEVVRWSLWRKDHPSQPIGTLREINTPRI